MRFNPYPTEQEAARGCDDVGTSLADVCADSNCHRSWLLGFLPARPSACDRGHVNVVIDRGASRARSQARRRRPLWGRRRPSVTWRSRTQAQERHLKLGALAWLRRAPIPTCSALGRGRRAFGADRLMWGSDFPFVQLNGGQKASLEAVRKFSSALAPEAQDAILGGTARRLFRLP